MITGSMCCCIVVINKYTDIIICNSLAKSNMKAFRPTWAALAPA
jgi:hypothetical protein